MACCQQIMEVLNKIIPFSATAAKDNSGLLVGEPANEVGKILMALDLTDAVIEEAITLGCHMIVSHHHIMGRGIKTVTPSTFEGRAIIALIKNNIAFCACHNNLDFLTSGTADALIQAAGVKESRPLYEGFGHLATTPFETNAARMPVPQGEGTREELQVGFGRIGQLAEPCTLAQLLQRLEGVVDGYVNVVGDDAQPIRTVAVQVGAGERVDMDRTKACGGDVLITGDVRHENRLYAQEIGLCLLDFGHYESECPGLWSLMHLFNKQLKANGYAVEVVWSQAPSPVRHKQMPPVQR